jgi:RHS repeat-associated protein
MARRRSRLQVLVIRAVVNCAGTNYVGNYYEATTGSSTKYYYAGGQRVAWRVNGTLYFGFSDHLSSTSITVDVNGTIVGNELYKAWGGGRYTFGSIQTTFKYTGQRQAEAGLYFYNARWYDPEVGRFIQADTIIPLPGNPLAWDRYAYGYNNPVNTIDPSGHAPPYEGADYICDEECRRRELFNYYEILQKNLDLPNTYLSDLEALARLTEYSSEFVENCASCMINDIGSILTGLGDGNPAGSELQIQIERRLARFGVEPTISYNPYYEEIRGSRELMQSGYSEIFQDPGELGKNQAHHFWFYVQVGYENGFPMGVAGSALHETLLGDPAGKSYNDYALGVEGAALGQMLALGIVQPGEVGNFIRNTLSPGSYSSQYWLGPTNPYTN